MTMFPSYQNHHHQEGMKETAPVIFTSGLSKHGINFSVFFLFLIVNLPSPSAKIKPLFFLFIFQPTCINNSIFIMRSNCPKVPPGCLGVPPNGAHWNSIPYIDVLLFTVL
jgi:hypothetical protein